MSKINLKNDFSSNFKKRYIIALSLIALLTLSSQLYIQSLLANQKHDSNIVNIAGRQRMLSQKITKLAMYLAFADSEKNAKSYYQQFKSSLDLWNKSHIGLQNGDVSLNLPGNNNNKIKSLFQKIEPYYENINHGAQIIISSEASNTLYDKLNTKNHAIKLIQSNESNFLKGMNEIVFQYASDAEDKVTFARGVEVTLALLTFLVLILEGLFIFKPATKHISNYINAIVDREKDFRLLFDSSPTALLMINTENRLVNRSNNEFLKLTNYASNNFNNLKLDNLLDLSQTTNISFIDEISRQNFKDKNEVEISLLDANSNSIEVLVSTRVLYLSNHNFFILGFTDIRQLKSVQRSLEHHATYDEFTGLLNRRTGLLFLKKAMAQASRNNNTLSIIYADLDGLKKINDLFGHAEGDKFIRTTSEIMRGLIRSSDSAARLGGDEFLIILPNCPLENADRIIQRLEQLLFSVRKNHTGQLNHYGISCGVTAYSTEKHSTPEELIADADSSMYAVKKLRKEQH